MYILKACVTHEPLLNVRLIVEILNFIALYGTDFPLSLETTRTFLALAAQIWFTQTSTISNQNLRSTSSHR